MDKYEYKLRLEEIKTLNKKGRFQEAAQVADTVDWNKVRNISTLCVISDVYKINRRFEDARVLLLMANEKSPQNRRISYALCDLTIKMGHIVEAVEYYKEFVQQAPNDNNRYILLYKIYEAQDISLEERIAVLKEYKKREYNEKWAYELAFLYHRVGLATECIEECDQLILWFGEGKYVIKAMELKQLYAALSPAQQQSYDRMTGRYTAPEVEEESRELQEEAEELAEEIPEEEIEEPVQEAAAEEKKADELEIQVKPMDMGQYNTINLQAALAESMREVLEPEEMPAADEYGGENAEYLEDVTRVITDSDELTNGVTGQLEEEETDRVLKQVEMQAVQAEPEQVERREERLFLDESRTVEFYLNQEVEEEEEAEVPGSSMDNLLSQEYDGQISLALPETRKVEKQITGQMNIEDVLREWERIKEENARKRKQETRDWVSQRTGSLFAEFDQQSRDGVLEQLEREAAAYEERFRRKQEEMKKTAVKAVEEIPEEVEELEEIEEMQDESWTQEDVARVQENVIFDEESVQEEPKPANAAARAVLAAGAAVVAEEVSEEESEVVSEAEQEAAEEVQETAGENEEDHAEEETAAEETVSEEIPEEETAEETVKEEVSEEETESKEEKQDEKRLEDTAMLHARIREEQIQEHMRHMGREERERFAPYVPTRGAMRQLVTALDSISISAFTGNVILTGAPGSDTMGLARNMIRSIRTSNNNFSGKVAKISGDVLNEKSVSEVISRIAGGALIVEKAGKLSASGAAALAAALNQEHTGVVVFAMDTRKAMERLMDRCAALAESFTARYDIAALDSATLVKYGCQYAYNQEFAIDELGRLALHTRIEDMQTNEHAVTVEEVREIVDEAIESASRRTLRHFWDIVLRRRYDDEDMIILRERDFI